MNRVLLALITLAFLLPVPVGAQQEEAYDYWRFNRQMVRYGQQAIMMCNGLFTSNRTLEQVFDQELAFLPQPVGIPSGGDYEVDWERKAVVIGAPGSGAPPMRAVFREGLGCMIMAPDQTFEDIESLPKLDMPPPPGDPATISWPDGDLNGQAPLPSTVDAAALQAASDWAFDRDTTEQVTLSLLVVHDGRIIHERYAPGFDMTTRTRTWSTAKSIASTLIGMQVDQGRMALDAPLPFDWFPVASSPDRDPRKAITLRHVLNMSSGLYPIDNFGLEYATGSGMSYWAGASSVRQARHKALIREPGTNWDYENYDTLLAVYAMKLAIGNDQAYLEYPRRALLDRIGMRNTLVSADRFGDFILSSQVYHERTRSCAVRIALSPEWPLGWGAADLRRLDRIRPYAGAGVGSHGQPVRRPVLARTGRPHRRAQGRLRHLRQPGPVHHHRPLARSCHRPAWSGLGTHGLQSLGT